MSPFEIIIFVMLVFELWNMPFKMFLILDISLYIYICHNYNASPMAERSEA